MVISMSRLTFFVETIVGNPVVKETPYSLATHTHTHARVSVGIPKILQQQYSL